MTKRLCRQIGFGKPLLFWGFSLAFGLSRRTSMCSALSSHILSLLYNQYYFIFAILPILLFFCLEALWKMTQSSLSFAMNHTSITSQRNGDLSACYAAAYGWANNHSICDWCRAFRHKTRMGQFFRKQFA